MGVSPARSWMALPAEPHESRPSADVLWAGQFAQLTPLTDREFFMAAWLAATRRQHIVVPYIVVPNAIRYCRFMFPMDSASAGFVHARCVLHTRLELPDVRSEDSTSTTAETPPSADLSEDSLPGLVRVACDNVAAACACGHRT